MGGASPPVVDRTLSCAMNLCGELLSVKAWNKVALVLAAALVVCLAIALIWSFVAVIFLIA